MTKVVSVDDPQSAHQPARLRHPCHLQRVLIAAGFRNRRRVTGVGHQLHPLSPSLPAVVAGNLLHTAIGQLRRVASAESRKHAGTACATGGPHCANGLGTASLPSSRAMISTPRRSPSASARPTASRSGQPGSRSRMRRARLRMRRFSCRLPRDRGKGLPGPARWLRE
jgi:hypothetical protein